MLTIGTLSFLAPWALTAFALLPALWWLLRATPPRPRRIRFPAIAFLFGLAPTDEAAVRMPPWLLLLRLLLAAVLILAIANPVLGRMAGGTGAGPLLLVVDNGWASAPGWAARAGVIAERLARADAENRPALVVATASPFSLPSLEEAGAALAEARTLEPQPWAPDRARLAERMPDIARALGSHPGTPEILWLADGLTHDAAGFEPLSRALAGLGNLEILSPPLDAGPFTLAAPRIASRGLTIEIRRAGAGRGASGRVRALEPQGRLVASAPFTFAEGARTSETTLEMPLALSNAVARLEIEGDASAGAVFLLDGRHQRRHVGIASPDGRDGEQPLLEAQTYLERAMAPFAEVTAGPLGGLLGQDVQMIALADVGQIVGGIAGRLTAWVEKGGLLLRFAGPHLANQDDALVPVPLRRGGRTLGGALDWGEPQRLAPFPEESPFAGLAIPEDVRVRRQVLAEPGSALAGTVWARLEDGTPLVTARRQGTGLLVLVHVTATPDWSSLALSGLFVEMLERIAALAPAGGLGAGAEAASAPAGTGIGTSPAGGVLPPILTLDGRGRLTPPPAEVRPLLANALESTRPGPDHPPGLYGLGTARAALNLAGDALLPEAVEAWPAGAALNGYSGDETRPLAPALFLLALVLLAADLLAMLALQGRLPRLARAGAAVLALALAAGWPGTGHAQNEARALEATLDTRLGYIRTGDARSDAIAKAGLEALTRELVRRTAVDAAAPLAVDLERDELAFFPLLYWRVAPAQEDLSPDALARLDTYLKSGGTVLFDTADLPEALPRPELGYEAAGPGTIRLRTVLKRLDVPALMPIPENHILTRSFFLLRDLPGRWTGGDVWVELASAEGPGIDGSPRETGNFDGVSSVIIGSHDWAGAWARDTTGAPVAAAVPGGERQREMAYRFGINLVMYALTGNYKADQVHIPSILERLGQ